MSTDRPRKRSGRYTQPDMPPRTLVRENGVTIANFYRSQGDHGPPHLHVAGKGSETRIGQNGHPLSRDHEPTYEQKTLIAKNKGVIRKALRKIGRWYFFEQLVDALSHDD
jgi:hypothetical protein